MDLCSVGLKRGYRVHPAVLLYKDFPMTDRQAFMEVSHPTSRPLASHAAATAVEPGGSCSSRQFLQAVLNLEINRLQSGVLSSEAIDFQIQ